MKRIASIFMVMVLVSGAVFARGNVETANGERSGRALDSSGDSVVLRGVIVEKDGHAVLENSEGSWSLSASGFPRAGVEIPYGETVEVNGSMVDCSDVDCDIEADGHIFVTEARSGNESYTFEGGRGAGDASRDRSGKNDSGRRASAGNSRGGNSRNAGGQGNAGTAGSRNSRNTVNSGARPMDGSGRAGSNESRGDGMGRRSAN